MQAFEFLEQSNVIPSNFIHQVKSSTSLNDNSTNDKQNRDAYQWWLIIRYK